MRCIQVVSSVTPKFSGLSYSVPSLSRAVAATGADCSLHVLAPPPDVEIAPAKLKVHPASRLIPRLGISPSMRRALAEEARTAEIMHTHSLWMMPNIYPAWAVEGTPCRLVTSPRGTLQAWALHHRRWRKRAMWIALQGRALRRTDCLNATAELEIEGFRRVGLRAPVAVIPNGIDIPAPVDPASTPNGRRRLLFLGRLHPKKGIEVLLKAWRNLQEAFPDWELLVAGEPDFPGYLDKVRGLATTIGAERTEFPGLVHGEAKSEMYRRSDLFVLPTSGENFGLTVGEALAHGVPVVVSKGAPWRRVESRRCGWWVDLGEGPLEECLRGAMALSRQELAAMGARGRDWMGEEFSWERVGRMMRETYDWLLGGGPPPDWVVR